MIAPRDRREMELGEHLCHDYGPDAFRDAISDELVREIGKLIQCGDLAAVGPLLARTLIADPSMQRSIATADQHEEQDRQRELFDAAQYKRGYFSNFDRETGIARSGEI